MFRNIAAPLLPLGNSEEERQKRDEMVERINSIHVFFVSALAHEAFEGRLKATKRQKQRLSEHFNDDPEATGIPGLKSFMNETAETYLSRFYYDELERQLEMEVDRVVRFFRQQWSTLDAQVSGGSQAITELVEDIDQSILPWLKQSVQAGAERFQNQSSQSAKVVTQHLSGTEDDLKRKLEYRHQKWCTFHWNSLKATARKHGIHTTYRGQFIDINQDICSVFVDELASSWSSYRDNFVRSHSETIVDEISSTLLEKLDEAAERADVPEATEAIGAIVTNLSTITRSQRDDFRRQVNAAIQELESIRKPAYDVVQKLMLPTYGSIQNECGTGCQERMRSLLCRGADKNVRQMWSEVSRIVNDAVVGLERRTAESLAHCGDSAICELRNAVEHLTEIGKVAHREKHLQQMEHIRLASLLLYQALTDAGKLLIMAPEPEPLSLPAPQRALPPPTPAAGTEADFPSNLPEAIEQDVPEPQQLESIPSTANGSHAVPTDPIDSPTIAENRTFDAEFELESLCKCPLFLEQKEQSGRTAPDDELTMRILTAMRDRHWKTTITALGEQVNLPAFRLPGILGAVQRILNVDGQQVLSICRSSDSVEINDLLLKQEFSF